MAIYTPVFKEIRKVLYRIVGEYIDENLYATTNEINEYIRKLKSEDQRKYKFIDFVYSVPYSDEVQEVLVDMVRHYLIKETDRGYELTLLGESFVGKEEWI